jgi:thioredoxin-related protein
MGKLIKWGIILVVIYWGLSFLGLNPFSGGNADAALAGLKEEALMSGRDKIVVLLTGTSWCPYCVELDREVIQTSAWKAYARTEVVFRSYEYPAMGRSSGGEKGELLKRFDVEGFPTMVVMDYSGKVLGERAGFAEGGVEGYKRWIESL